MWLPEALHSALLTTPPMPSPSKPPPTVDLHCTSCSLPFPSSPFHPPPPTFFFSGSSLYFLDRILVRSRLLISGWSFAYLARFSMKKRK